VKTRTRVFLAAASEEERARLIEDAARAGWVVVDRASDADLILGPAAAWRAEPEAAGESRRIREAVGGSARDRDDRPDRPLEALTPRELDVLTLLADGVGNREIARRLEITEHTVKFHLSAVFGKLGATTRTEAVRRALRYGLIHL
jgi:DNA-binding NarL/FixJ family response regulator